MQVRVNDSSTMPDYDQEKRGAAEYSVRFIEDGMAVGLGSGSTASHFIRSLGDRVRNGLRIRAIPTSERSGELARESGIELTDFGRIDQLDVTVDGADEIDPDLNLIKGGGGALLREKIVASATQRLIIIGNWSRGASASCVQTSLYEPTHRGSLSRRWRETLSSTAVLGQLRIWKVWLGNSTACPEWSSMVSSSRWLRQSSSLAARTSRSNNVDGRPSPIETMSQP